MKGFSGRSRFNGTFGNERGSSSYSFLGFAIIAVVVVAAIVWFPWDQVFETGKDAGILNAKQAMVGKQWKSAIGFFDSVIKADPKNVDAFMGRSLAELQLGEGDKALEDANKAVEMAPKSAVAYAQRGLVQKRLGKNGDAEKDFTQAITLDPGYAWALGQRADIYSSQNKPDKALADIEAALKANPQFVEALRMKAWILSRAGKCKEASVVFATVIEKRPNDPASVQDAAWFLMTCPDEKLQDPVKAKALAEKAEKLSNGKDGMVLETLAEAYFRGGDALKAADTQKKAIEITGKKCPDGSCTAEMKERLKKYELAARQETRKSYEILPMDPGLKK